MDARRRKVTMETRAHNHTGPPRRLLGSLGLLLALLVVAACLAATGAAARPERSHHASCSSTRHAKHASAKHCSKHRGHKSKKPASKPTSAPKLTPAACEDGSAPVRDASSGAYTCEDGSEPICQDGSAPIRPTASSAPMCHVVREGTECTLGAKECAVEFSCEEEATEGPQGCEHGSALEEEELEA
jgi:hypothetical protein